MAALRRNRIRTAALVAVGVALAAALAFALRPRAIEVETATAARGPIRVTVDGTGKMRVRDLYVVASPAAGHLERVPVREGDPVRAGQVVARIVPAAPAPLDARTRAELEARLEAARAAEALARASAERARVSAAQAERDLDRAKALAAGGSIAASAVEAADTARRASIEEARMAASAVARAAGEVEAARAAAAAHALPVAGARAARSRGEGLDLRAPVAGRVLRVQRESEGPIAAGAPVLDVGDPATLEAEVELLTTQAVRVRPGAPVEVVRWGGEAPLRGAVRAVDPAGFTKVSALGVEEQRVHVVVDPDGPGWERLGEGFAVEARIVVAERADALKVPASALFRVGPRWSTFVVDRGHARLREVDVAESSGVEVAIASGLAEGERVVLHPPEGLSDGALVAIR